jgi:acetyl-CoA acetyltransferase family protein
MMTVLPPERTPVLVDAVRTPTGRLNGALRQIRSDELAAHVLRGLLARTPALAPEEVSDVILGCANQAGEDCRNIARQAALLAGLPVTVPGLTLNRLCGSGMSAIFHAMAAIQAGMGDVFIAGGVESMSRAPWVRMKAGLENTGEPEEVLIDSTIGWRFTHPALRDAGLTDAMPETAERVAEREGISREQQDVFTLESHAKAYRATQAGLFAPEILALPVLLQDETIRYPLDARKLGRLKPIVRPGGTVTAANASGLNDGATALLILSQARAEALGLRPLARLRAGVTVGVDPRWMGLAPVDAISKLLAQTGLATSDVGWFELNEAFAATTLACIRALALSAERVNPLGGALALGNPLGAAGARIVTTLAHHLAWHPEQRRFGVAALCVGVGQGMALLLERGEDPPTSA